MEVTIPVGDYISMRLAIAKKYNGDISYNRRVRDVLYVCNTGDYIEIVNVRMNNKIINPTSVGFMIRDNGHIEEKLKGDMYIFYYFDDCIITPYVYLRV